LPIRHPFLVDSYLAQHNRKYAVAAQEKADYHLRVPPRLDRNQVFCLEEARIVSADWVVQYGQRWLQIEREGQTARVERGATVMVREHRDGRLSVWLKGAKLRWHELPERPRKAAPPPKQHVVRRPPAGEHPWREVVYRNAAASDHRSHDLLPRTKRAVRYAGRCPAPRQGTPWTPPAFPFAPGSRTVLAVKGSLRRAQTARP
jgi:hypothetical protein